MLADKLYSDIDTILTASERCGTTARLKTVAIYFSYDELKTIREALAHEAARELDTAREVNEWSCPGHIASENDPKICARCGVHINSLR